MLQLAAAAVAAMIVGQASVIDGDTIEIHGQRIRLWGVDALEGRQTCTKNGQPWGCGKDAALALADIIGGRPVTCTVKDHDRYQRAVASCQIILGSDNYDDLGYRMVRLGWALDFKRYSRGEFARPEALAREQLYGVWASTFEAPWDWRRTHPR